MAEGLLSKRKGTQILRTVDAFLYGATGHGLKHWSKKGIDAAIEALASKIEEIADEQLRPPPLPQDLQEAYKTLHCQPGDNDTKVKYMFRVLVKETHPDIAACPNEEEFARVVEAYNVITTARHKPAGKPAQ